MARNRVAYATVPPGSQYNEGGLPVVSPNYDIILDRRRNWWWEPGPVDSCCFCCHLEEGIVVLAGLRTAVNANALLANGFLYSLTHDSQIWLLEGVSSTSSFYAYLTGFCSVVSLAGGMAGLCAGCTRNTFAAKLFFLSWPTSLALSIISWIASFVIIEQLNIKALRSVLLMLSTIMLAVQVFFYIYFMKVSWSYYTVLKTRDTSLSSSIESDIELVGLMNDREE